MATVAALRHRELPVYFDGMRIGMDLWCAIHAHLLGDLFEWAGSLRTISLIKNAYAGSVMGPVTQFVAPANLVINSERIFQALAHENFLAGLPIPLFVQRLADYYAQLNLIHPFREGNGRAQRALFQILARRAGHELVLDAITRERWVAASIAGVAGNLQPFVSLFRDAVDPECVALVRNVVAMVKHVDPDKWNDRSIALIDAGVTATGNLGRAPEAAFLGIGSHVLIVHFSDLPPNPLYTYRCTISAKWQSSAYRAQGPFAKEADLYRQAGAAACRAAFPELTAYIDRVEQCTLAAQVEAQRLAMPGIEANRFVIAATERGLAVFEWAPRT